MRLLLPLLVLATAGTAPSAPPPPVHVDVKTGPAAEAIHANLAGRVAEGFGGAILVEKDGAVVLRAGYGWADRERRTPFTTSTIAQVGSLTKQFTATAIVDLSLQGKLAFSDPLKRHLEGVPAPAAGITIHQLLTHTAGLRTDCGLDFEKVTRSELVTRCLAQVDRPPGKFAYSNLGYSVLAAVVEVVSGKPLEDYLAERFLRPLGMTRTGYFFEDSLRGSLASGYTADGPKPPISERLRPLGPAFWNLKGNGGMQASVEDMYTWYRALAQGPVLTEAMRRTLTTPQARRDDGVGYGYGWFVRTRADGSGGEVEQVSHTGSDGVFFSASVWRPLEKTFYYFVTNTGEEGGAEVAGQVLRVLTGGPPVEKQP